MPPAGAPALVPTTEVLSLRTAHAKTFATEQPGKYTSRVYANPIHFKDAAGAWQDIDMTLVPQPDGRLRSRAHSSAVSVAPLADDERLARVDFDADHSVAYGLHGASPVPVHVSGTLGSYTSVLPDVSLELRGYWAGLKEDLVLASRAAPDTYLFPLKLRGVSAHLVEGEVVYKDAEGKEWGRTPKGWMRDSRLPPASEDPSQDRPQTFSEGVTYELVPHAGGTALKVTLDRAWLDDPARVYPVRVDPTTTFGANTDDTYVQTNDTTRNDTFNDLNVGTTSAGANKMRSFIHFDTWFLRGRAKGIGYTRIATYLFDYWGGSGHRPNSMYRVNQGWWGGNMASYPGATVGEEVARREVHASVHWEQWDNQGILDMVHMWNVCQCWEDHGIMLKAFDENDNSQYRHYHSANQPGAGPHLVTDWWGEPNTPDWISPGDGTYDNPPTLHARYTHSDEGTYGTLWFDLYNSGGGWLGGRSSSGRCHGCTGTHVPNDLSDGRYQWDVIAVDDAGRWGPRTGRTWFTLDRRPYVPDQLSPATGAQGQSPPTLSARYNHPDPGNASGQVVFKLYNASDTFLSETYSASVCKGCTATHTPTGLADGLYKWEAVAYDGGGTGNGLAFSGASERRTFRVDTTAPAAPVVSSSSHPQERTWSTQSAFQASWTEPSDATGISGYSVVLDEAADTVPPTTVSHTERSYSAALADGVHFLHVRARDGVGNWGPTDHYEVWSDSATPGAPTVTSPTHVDQTVWYANPDYTVDWAGGDTASGLAGWSFAMDGTPDDTSEGTFASSSGLGLTDGTHTFRVKRKNNAGTWGNTASFSLNVDATPPAAPTTSSSTHPSTSAWYANADPAVSWSATDTAPVDGYSWVLDQSASTVPDTVSEGTGTSASWTGRADGVWYLHVRARNKAGLWGTTHHRTIRVDAVVEAPTVSSGSHPAQATWYALDDVDLAWAATAQSQSGASGWSYTFNGTDPDTTSEGTATTRSYPDMPDGTYTFKLRVLDGLGRWSGTTSHTVNVDTSAPTISSTSSSTHAVEANWYNNANPSVSWASSDTAPVDGYSWVLDQISTTTPNTTSEGTGTSTSWTGLADGLWWFHVRSRNATGTWGPAVHRAVRVDTTAPTAPPVSSSTHPVEGTWYTSNGPSFAFATTDHSGVDNYSYVLDQVATTTPDTTSEGSATTKSYTGLANGTHWFHVRARNGLGMWGTTAHFSVRVDTANGAPSVTSSTHPSPSAWYSSESPSLAWSGSYPSGVVGWSYELSQSATTVPDTTSEGTAATKSYTGLADGTHWFHVRAQTGATWSQTAHFAINVDTSAPAAPTVTSSTHPSETTWYANDDPSVSFPVTDTAPVDGYSWVLNQTTTTDPDTTSDTTATTLAFSGLTDGLHWFHVRARNATGTWGTTRHFAIRVDTTASAAPTISSPTHPSQTTWYANDDPAFSFPASDTSGVAGYSFDLNQTSTTDPDTTSEGTSSTKSYTDLADGTWWFHVRTLNGSGLWSTTSHYKVQVDDTAPGAPTITSSTHPSQTSWSAQPNATLSFAKTDTAPVNGYSWQLDQDPAAVPDTVSEGTSSAATVTPGEGTYYFHVRTRNSSGLWSTTSHYTLKTDAVTGSPTISSSTHPDQDVWYPSRAVELTWTASEESGITGYATSVTPDAPGNPGFIVNTTTPAASIGVAEDRVWYVNVRAFGNTGVWGPMSSYRIKADSTQPPNPVVSSSTHAVPGRWTVNDDPQISFSSSDVSGITGYSYELDHDAETVPDTTSEGTDTAKTYTDVAEGEWWFHVRARNGAGTWGATTHFVIRVDVTRPGLEHAGVRPQVTNVGNDTVWTVNWDTSAAPVFAIVCKSDALEGNGQCRDGQWAAGSPSDTGVSEARRTATTEDYGHHNFVAFACDLAGLCSEGGRGWFDVAIPSDHVGNSGQAAHTTYPENWQEEAYRVGDWFAQRWDVTRAHRWQFVQGFPADNRFRDRVRGGFDVWMTHAREAGLPLVLEFAGENEQAPGAWTDNCNTLRADTHVLGGTMMSVVQWGEAGDSRRADGTIVNNPNTLGINFPCLDDLTEGSNPLIVGFITTVDDDQDWHVDAWEMAPFTSDRFDLQALAAHEAGHGMGFGSVPGSPSGGHFNDEGPRCPDDARAHTMCPTIIRGTSGQRSLEVWDRLEFSRGYSQGYYLAAENGAVYHNGWARHYGDTSRIRLNQPVVAMSARPDNSGYWLFARDGGVFNFGAASFHGSTGGIRLNQPIVGAAAHPSGNGYWLVASDGGVFAFGAAAFHGSMGAHRLNQPVVGMAATPSGNGYWLVASDGGIFSFGDAQFHGSTGSIRLNRPIVGMAAHSSGAGYWLVATDGGVFNFGAATFHGSLADDGVSPDAVTAQAILSYRRGTGYNIVAWDQQGAFARVRRFGTAPFWGHSPGGLNFRVVAAASVGSPVDADHPTPAL